MSSNMQSKQYTGNRTFDHDVNREYLFIMMLVGSGEVVLGGTGEGMPLLQGAYYEPYVTPTSSI